MELVKAAPVAMARSSSVAVSRSSAEERKSVRKERVPEFSFRAIKILASVMPRGDSLSSLKRMYLARAEP